MIFNLPLVETGNTVDKNDVKMSICVAPQRLLMNLNTLLMNDQTLPSLRPWL